MLNRMATKLNLACGHDLRPESDGWLNVDSIDADGVTRMDILSLPWPFESGSFDLILAKHILEHTPHNLPGRGNATNLLHELMEEMWRVLRVGGIVEIVVPGGISSFTGAIDHKRIITPETFHIFYPGDKWGYYTRCRFELLSVDRTEPRRFRWIKWLARKLFLIDITQLRAHECRFRLRKLPASNKERTVKYTVSADDEESSELSQAEAHALFDAKVEAGIPAVLFRSDRHETLAIRSFPED